MKARGQVMVVTALALAALLAFTALVINVGLFMVERRHLQNAVDAAALAGSLKLAEEHSSRSLRDAPGSTAVSDFVVQNQVTIGATRTLQAVYVNSTGNPLGTVGAGGQFAATATGVDVTISGPFASILGAFLGSATITVQGEAQARFVRLDFPSVQLNPVPLAVPLAAFQSGASYDLYDQTVASTSYGVSGYKPFVDMANSANSGTLYLAGTSYGDFAVNLQYWADGVHSSGRIGVGTQLALADGSAASVRAGLLDNVRRQGLTDGSGQPYAVIPVPIWDTYTTGSPNKVRVVGYGAFRILQTDIGLTSLRGYFVPSFGADTAPIPTPSVLWGPSKVVLVN